MRSEWKLKICPEDLYDHLTVQERTVLLDRELRASGTERRKDSKLAAAFIRGNEKTMNVQQCAAIMDMTSRLFEYGHRAFSKHSDSCNRKIEDLMFKNRDDDTYTWGHAVSAAMNSVRNLGETLEEQCEKWS